MSLTVHGDLASAFQRRRGACALIAIKARAHCKTRLAAALDEPARVALVRSMLATVLTAVAGAETVHQAIVIVIGHPEQGVKRVIIRAAITVIA